MSLFSTLKDNAKLALEDLGSVYYSPADINDSFADGYNDILILTQCLIKKVSIPFQTTPYYDFKALGVSDFLAVTAIFNTNTNRWLADDKTKRDFDLMRSNWELWTGTPDWWAPHNFRYNIIVPSYTEVPNEEMDLYYWATAPVINDTDTPLIATDLQRLLELYTVPDLLEQAQEFKKANEYWKAYYELIELYSERNKTLANADIRRLA